MILIKLDRDCEMMEIEVNGRHKFCGNYWDFSVPTDLIDLLKAIPNLEMKVDKGWEYVE